MGNGTGHVGHAVEEASIDLERGIRVGGRAGGLEASALVDGDVDQHRAGPHARHQLVGDQFRGLAPTTNTAPMTMSASKHVSSMAWVLDATVSSAPRK